MTEDIMWGEVSHMISGRRVKSLMHLKGREGGLSLEIFSGLFPNFFTLIGFIDHILADWYFLVINEGL
jgi:hypothetical protein